ncbi:MAG: TIGR01777 family oxidoreductase [Desulfovibrionales bacterium]
MQYFVLGGTGFLGTRLIEHLVEHGHKVDALVRPGSALRLEHPALRAVQGNALKEGPWQEYVGRADVVVNLVGTSVLARWTKEVKKRILLSRVLSTEAAVRGLTAKGGQIFFCANAVGYYGDRGDEILVEESGPGEGFLSDVCKQWQHKALEASERGHRVLVGRFAPVLDRAGGMMDLVLSVFKKGIGGKLGKGDQWMAWIHREDLVRAIRYLVEETSLSGPVNIASPSPVTNEEFTRTVGDVLGRPTLFKVPSFALKLVLHEGASAILSSERAIPAKLQSIDFLFYFSELRQAVEEIVQKDKG